MIYEFKFRSQEVTHSDLDLVYGDPRLAWRDYMILSQRLKEDDFALYRDGKLIDTKELASDIDLYKIDIVINEEIERLPATARSGWGANADITIGTDGQPTSVEKKKNPEDNFE